MPRSRAVKFFLLALSPEEREALRWEAARRKLSMQVVAVEWMRLRLAQAVKALRQHKGIDRPCR